MFSWRNVNLFSGYSSYLEFMYLFSSLRKCYKPNTHCAVSGLGLCFCSGLFVQILSLIQRFLWTCISGSFAKIYLILNNKCMTYKHTCICLNYQNMKEKYPDFLQVAYNIQSCKFVTFYSVKYIEKKGHDSVFQNIVQ